MLEQILENKIGQILLSMVLGLGLAAIFRKVCSGNNCIVVQSPNLQDIKKYYYKIDEDCYRYEPYATKCEAT